MRIAHGLLACACAAWATCCTGGTTTIGTPDADSGTTPDSSPDGLPTDAAVDPGPPPVDYVLHEWGVFVFEGSGASLHGPTPEVAEISVDKPVIYLYSEEAFTLDLTVGFSSGASTETWPVRPSAAFVEWSGLAVGPGGCETTPFPTIYENPWLEETCEACTLGSCVVSGASCLRSGDTVSTLLFYAGTMPAFRPRLEGSVWTEGTEGTVGFEVSNVSSRPVRGAWFLYRTTTSVCEFPEEVCPVTTADLALSYFDVIEPGSGFGSSMPLVHLEAELDESGYPVPGTLGAWDEWEDLAGDLRAGLLARGLYGEEADAFVSAWDTALFGLLGMDSSYIEPMYRNGGMLLYFLERDEYDALLPLEASPGPAASVRLGMVIVHL